MVYISPAVALSAAAVFVNAANGVSASPVSSRAPSPFTTLTVASTQAPSATSYITIAAPTCIPVPTNNRAPKGRHARRTGRARKNHSKLPPCKGPTPTPSSGGIANTNSQSEILTEFVQPTAAVQQTIAARARRGQRKNGISLTPEQQSKLAALGAKAAEIFGGDSPTTTAEPTSTAGLARRAKKKGLSLTPEQQSKLAEIGAKAAEIFGGGSSTTTAEPTSTAALVARRAKKNGGERKGGIVLSAEQKERLAHIGSKAFDIFRNEETSISVSSTSTAEGTQQTIAARRTRKNRGGSTKSNTHQAKPAVSLTPAQRSGLAALGGKIFSMIRGEESTTSSEISTSTSATVSSTAEATTQTT